MYILCTNIYINYNLIIRNIILYDNNNTYVVNLLVWLLRKIFESVIDSYMFISAYLYI